MHQGLVDYCLQTDTSKLLEDLLEGRLKVVDGDVPFPCENADHIYTGFQCEDIPKFMEMDVDAFRDLYLLPVLTAIANNLLEGDKPVRAGKLPLKTEPFKSGRVPQCVVHDGGIIPVRVTISYHRTRVATDKLDTNEEPIMRDWKGHRVFFDVLTQEVE